MPILPFVADRRSALEAARLLTEYGGEAVAAAGTLARRSRDRGNLVDFCRWRQIERLIHVLDDSEGTQTRH